MDATATEFIWSAIGSGFIAPVMIVIVVIVLGGYLGRKWQGPRDYPSG